MLKRAVTLFFTSIKALVVNKNKAGGNGYGLNSPHINI